MSVRFCAAELQKDGSKQLTSSETTGTMKTEVARDQEG